MTWSHFVVLLPIEDELKRDFYAAMCKSENWSVRVLRERKNSMLYERTAISKKPDETIKNDIDNIVVSKKEDSNLDFAMVNLLGKLDDIKNRAKKIGVEQRMFFTYFFRELFNPNSDSYLDMNSAIESGFNKYISLI